ncbi:MAG: hypothetical protein DYH13_10960 [Alphaproteobacteria bacterium PRO2]|nr:hypothetical protein [Alphaproteobacteria bacterium PRO2]
MGESRKFHTAEGLSKKFDAVSTKWGKLSAVVEAANNFLGMFDAQTDEDVKRLLVNAATNPGSVTSIMATSYTPNFDPVEEKKKEEEARDALLEMLKEQIRQSNERISKMIDKCFEMAEWCRKQAEKAAEAMDKIATRMAKNSEFINEVDELFESYKATGHFDREKARKLLRERGIKTGDDISKEKLLELLQKEQLSATENNKELSERYEEQKEQEEKFKTWREEIEKLANELKQRRDEINEDAHLSLEEKAQRIKELEEQYTVDVQNKAKKLEANKEKQAELEAKLQETYLKGEAKQEAKDENKDFTAGLDALSGQFTAAADPAKKPVDPITEGANNMDRNTLEKNPTLSVFNVGGKG